MPPPSIRPGLGSIPFPGGVTFRVWAPFAPWVAVAGSFNGWSAATHRLASEGNGYWSADFGDAAVGDQYRYVLGDHHWRVDPRALAVTQSDGNGVITKSAYLWRKNDFQMPPWHELVVYEMHVASYPDNPVAPNEMLDAVAGDLKHLQDLGINAIELMPAGEFPGDNSWGYNPVHVFAVEHAYGGPHALKNLVDAAHDHGIAVILDVVYNHFGPSDLEHSVWQLDGWFGRRWDGQDMGGIYFYNDWRARTDWGEKNRPDYGRPEVREFIRDNVLFWLQEYRVDGLRFDMTCFIRNVDARDDLPLDDPTNLDGWGWNLLRWVNDEVNRVQPWKLTVAEDMRQNWAVTRATGAGGAGFDSQWDDQFHHTLRRAMVVPRDEDRDVWAVKAAIERRFDGDAVKRVIYTESHDEVGDPYGRPSGKQRVPEEIQPGHADGWYAKKRSTLGAAAVFTSPGIPMIFQGQEMLEWIQFTGNSRMDWNKVDRLAGIVTLYRDLIRLRRNWFNNTRGLRGHQVNVFHVNPADKVIGFHRWQEGGAGDDVVVVLNFGTRGYPSYTLGFPRPGSWYVRFNSDWSGYSPDFGNFLSYDTTAGPDGRDGMPCQGNVGIGPYTAVILSQ